jgi:hypothetical protein
MLTVVKVPETIFYRQKVRIRPYSSYEVPEKRYSDSDGHWDASQSGKPARFFALPDHETLPPVGNPGVRLCAARLHCPAVAGRARDLGEGANQPFVAKPGTACAIRNRGTLQGVCGVENVRAQRCPRRVYNEALRGEASAGTDITHGCRHFGRPTDASYFVETLPYKSFVKYGDITFHKP